MNNSSKVLTIEEASEVLYSQLTKKEKDIFNFLQEMLDFYKYDNVVLRVVGGWVRDKLLLKDASDIDIGIEGMAGVQLAEKLNEYIIYKEKLKLNQDKIENEENLGIASKIGIIQANPEKSKHLETAKVHVFDEEIDFVNLRTESYADGSRIPQMEFGTPKEDAYRRDFCVNALFYNLKTKKVEDFTNHGLEDLKNKILRTPLDPIITFHDDPLRILRAIRFAGKLNYNPTYNLETAIKDENVLCRLISHVSRQRFGAEIVGAFSSLNPDKSLKMMGLSYIENDNSKDTENVFYWVYKQPIESILTQEAKEKNQFNVNCKFWTQTAINLVKIYINNFSDYNLYADLNCDLKEQDRFIKRYTASLSKKDLDKFILASEDANLQFYNAFYDININNTCILMQPYDNTFKKNANEENENENEDEENNQIIKLYKSKIENIREKWLPLPEKVVNDVHGKAINNRFLLVQTLIIIAALLDENSETMYLKNELIEIDTTPLVDLSAFKKKKISLQFGNIVPKVCVAQGNAVSKIISQAVDIIIQAYSCLINNNNKINVSEKVLKLILECDNVSSVVIAIISLDIIINYKKIEADNIIIQSLKYSGVFTKFSLGEWKFVKSVVGGKFLMEIANKCNIKNKALLANIVNATAIKGLERKNYLEWITNENIIRQWIWDEEGDKYIISNLN